MNRATRRRLERASLIAPATRYAIVGAFVWAVSLAVASAQDMEPRAYSASPVGLNFLGVGYNRLTGGVAVDPDLPISDVRANVKALVVGVSRTFNLFGDLGLVTAGIPYSLADVTGNVFEQQQEAKRSGLANALVKLSVNFLGNPALSPEEFAAAARRTILGASIAAIAPTGQYYRTKLVNLGTNRWAFKPEMGLSVPNGPWYVDAYVGAWFFTANREFFPGSSTRTQDTVLTVQGPIP